MEPEAIDWNNIDSIFVEDDTYEHLNAPKWVDFSAPDDEHPFDDVAWFCHPDCKHLEAAEDYGRSKNNSKVKFLRSVTISEIFPFKNRTRRDAKLKTPEIPNPQTTIKGSEFEYSLDGECENHNPNSQKGAIQQESWRKAGLRSRVSGRNLLAGKEILNQITEFCSELKKFGKKGSSSKRTIEKFSNVGLSDKERLKGKERQPLLEVKKIEASWS